MKDKYVNILVCLLLCCTLYVMMTTEMSLDVFFTGMILYFFIVIKATMYLHKRRYHR